MQRRNQQLPGVPPGVNHLFDTEAEAAQAAWELAQRMGPGYAVHHHIYQFTGLKHYHVSAPDGRFLAQRFFYGMGRGPM